MHETTPYRRDFSPEVEDRSAAHRDSLPYCELAIVAEPQDAPRDRAAAVSLDGSTERDLPPPPELFAESSDVWTVKREKVDPSKLATVTREKVAKASTSDDSDAKRHRAETAETSKVSTVPATSVTGDSTDELAVTSERIRLGRGSGAQPKHGAAVVQPRRGATPATVNDRPPRIAGELSWLGVVVAQPELGAPLVIGTWLGAKFRVTSPVARLLERDDGVLVETVTKSRYFVKPAGDAYLVRKPG